MFGIVQLATMSTFELKPATDRKLVIFWLFVGSERLKAGTTARAVAGRIITKAAIRTLSRTGFFMCRDPRIHWRGQIRGVRATAFFGLRPKNP